MVCDISCMAGALCLAPQEIICYVPQWRCSGSLQAFNWESHNQNWYQRVTEQANRFASLGFTCVWLPPFTESVSPQGYMPLDLYNLNSRYGSEEDLRR